jgi:hypothetical protein
MAIFVVDVRDKKTPGRRRYNVSRRPHHRDDIHASRLGNPFGKGYELAEYTKWAVANHAEQLERLGRTGAQQDIELACWCHAKPRCHAHLVKRLAEEMMLRTVG